MLERLIYNPLYNFSTSLVVNYLTDKTREQLDSGNFSSGRFFDVQKAFETVDHDIFMQKMKHYSIREVTNNNFLSYLQNQLQYFSINGFDSNLEHVQCNVPKGSVLGQLLFFCS